MLESSVDVVVSPNIYTMYLVILLQGSNSCQQPCLSTLLLILMPGMSWFGLAYKT